MAEDPAATLREVVERVEGLRPEPTETFLVMRPSDALILLAAAKALLSMWEVMPRLAAAVRPEESPPS